MNKGKEDEDYIIAVSLVAIAMCGVGESELKKMKYKKLRG